MSTSLYVKETTTKFSARKAIFKMVLTKIIFSSSYNLYYTTIYSDFSEQVKWCTIILCDSKGTSVSQCYQFSHFYNHSYSLIRTFPVVMRRFWSLRLSKEKNKKIVKEFSEKIKKETKQNFDER